MAGTPGRRDVVEACAAFGLDAAVVTGGDCAPEATPSCEVWPEHALAVAVFIRMRGQWRTGPGGPFALDYGALPVVYAALRLRPRQVRRVFEAVRDCEAEALRWFAEQQS